MRQRQIECKSEVPSLRALRATYPQVIHSLAYPARHPSIIARFAALVKKYDKIKKPAKAGFNRQLRSRANRLRGLALSNLLAQSNLETQNSCNGFFVGSFKTW